MRITNTQHNMEKILTWEHLQKVLPLLNSSEIERRCGLRSRRIADVKNGKSTLSAAELETIRQTLQKILG